MVSHSFAFLLLSCFFGKGSPAAILLLGGRYSTDSIETFNPSHPSSNALTNHVLLMSRQNLVAAVIKSNVLYGAGLNLELGFLNTTEIYHPSTGGVTTGPLMTHNRNDPAAAVVADEQMVICGGWFANRALNSCEMLISGDKFIETMPMDTARFGLSMVSVDNTLYAIGGSLDNKNNYTNAVEWYEQAAFCWGDATPMVEKRVWAASAVLNGAIVTCGGCNEKCLSGLPIAKALMSCEVYDVKSKKWSPFANMIRARMGHSMVELGGKLYVLGGENEDTVEVYQNGKWQVMGTKLIVKRAFSAAVVI